jgi:hypothetical protein
LIRTRRIQLHPANTRFSLHMHLAAAGRLAEQLDGVKRLVRADSETATNDTAAATLGFQLDGLINVSEHFTVSDLDNDPDPPEYSLAVFDERDNLALISVFVGERRGSGMFFEHFDLPEDESRLIEEDTLGYIVTYVPDDMGREPFPAIALTAFGEDNWAYDGHNMPLELRCQLIALGKQELARL